MSGGFVPTQVRRTGINLLLACGAGVLAVAALAAANADYLYNVFNGPFPVAQETLSQGPVNPRRQYLEVQFARLVPTRAGRIKTVNGVKTNDVVSRFYLAPVGGGKVMIVDVDNRQSGPAFEGRLEPIDQNLRSRVLPLLEQEFPGLSERLAPSLFVARDYCGDAFAGLGVGGLATAFCIIGIFAGIRRVVDPQSHPACRLLRTLGDPPTVEAELETELAGGAKVLGRCRFTKNWVVYREPFRFRLIRLSELVWMYQRVVRHYYNGIPTGKSHSVILCDRHGTKIQIPVSAKIAEPLLAGLFQMAPWAAVGFGAQLEWQWKHDQPSMAAMANARRASMARPPAAPPLAA